MEKKALRHFRALIPLRNKPLTNPQKPELYPHPNTIKKNLLIEYRQNLPKQLNGRLLWKNQIPGPAKKILTMRKRSLRNRKTVLRYGCKRGKYCPVRLVNCVPVKRV